MNPHPPRRDRFRRLAAGLATTALVAMGMLTAPAAHAATTTAALTAVSAADGVTVRVTGTGYTDLPPPSTGSAPAGAYVAVIDAATTTWDDLNANTAAATLAVAFLPIATAPGQTWAIEDGAFTTDLTVAAADVTPDTDLEVLTWVAHGDLTNDTLLFRQTLPLAEDQLADLAGGTDESAEEAAEETTDEPATTTKAPQGEKPEKKTSKKAMKSTSAKTPEVQCTTETVPANLGTPRLSWAIKSSFLSYVDSNLADGTVAAGGGAAWNGSTVTWGTGSGSLSSDGLGTLSFPGTLHITGHGGILDLTISNLTVRSTGGKAGMLTATISSSDMQGNPLSASGDLATLSFSSLSQTGGTASTTLTANGATAFAGFYSAGEALDPLTVTFAGSSPATTVKRCTDADGNLVSPDGTRIDALASTGIDAPAITLTAGVLMLAGLGMVLLGRRRDAADHQ